MKNLGFFNQYGVGICAIGFGLIMIYDMKYNILPKQIKILFPFLMIAVGLNCIMGYMLIRRELKKAEER